MGSKVSINSLSTYYLWSIVTGSFSKLPVDISDTEILDETNAGTGISGDPGSSASDTKSSVSTVHTNPQWKDELRSKFKELIVLKCSEASRTAFEENVDIEVVSEEIFAYWPRRLACAM